MFCFENTAANVDNTTNEQGATAMDIVSEYQSLTYTDTEKLIADTSIFKVDNISIDDAENDVLFNANKNFEESGIIPLFCLNFDLEECTNKWSKRIEQLCHKRLKNWEMTS